MHLRYVSKESCKINSQRLSAKKERCREGVGDSESWRAMPVVYRMSDRAEGAGGGDILKQVWSHFEGSDLPCKGVWTHPTDSGLLGS